MMSKRVSYALFIIIILAASIAYTYTYYQGQVSGLQSQVASLREELVRYQNITITLVDDTGYVITLTRYPEKIVSLAPSNTEILFAIGAGSKVVGVTKYDDYPYNFTAWAKEGKITIVGGVVDVSIETVVSLDPDLILAVPLNGEAVKKLRDLGYNVLVLDPKNINDILKDILLVGRATGYEGKAIALVKSMRLRIDKIINKVAKVEYKPKVYCEVWNKPLMSAGPGTFIDELIRLAGGVNIFGNASTEWPVVSSESVIKLNPDIIIVPAHHGKLRYSIEEIKSRPGWDQINAVKNNRIYIVDSDIFSRPGPRIVDALEILAKILHPELFGNATLSSLSIRLILPTA